MEAHGCVVGVYENEEAALAAFKELQKAGYSVEQVSVVGKLHEIEEHSVAATKEDGAAPREPEKPPDLKTPVHNGSTILGASFNSVGILKENAQRYEQAVNAGKFLVVAEGLSPDVVKAVQVLHATPHVEVVQHSSETAAGAASS
jgi:hypothetical protein